ncbi:hypothetical protein MtrunA17_Chr5g0433611 [Medicago truncatula]|uniref:Uncharacterized protein n=1 Tax=Medicago truncatula TaxID=3880 RepID=A0A396HW98_MEDTR|nr:hypothetical protein MtrunA17_Chr5g0433611 [Medicago truncatula]
MPIVSLENQTILMKLIQRDLHLKNMNMILVQVKPIFGSINQGRP